MIDYQEIIDGITEENIKSLLDKLEIPYQDKGNFLSVKLLVIMQT